MFLHTCGEQTASLAHIVAGILRARDSIHDIPPWEGGPSRAPVFSGEIPLACGRCWDYNPFSRRSLDFQSFWYLSLGMPIFAIIPYVKYHKLTKVANKNCSHFEKSLENCGPLRLEEKARNQRKTTFLHWFVTLIATHCIVPSRLQTMYICFVLYCTF